MRPERITAPGIREMRRALGTLRELAAPGGNPVALSSEEMSELVGRIDVLIETLNTGPAAQPLVRASMVAGEAASEGYSVAEMMELNASDPRGAWELLEAVAFGGSYQASDAEREVDVFFSASDRARLISQMDDYADAHGALFEQLGIDWAAQN